MSPRMENRWVRYTGDGSKGEEVINRCSTIKIRMRLRNWIWRREIKGKVLISSYKIGLWVSRECLLVFGERIKPLSKEKVIRMGRSV